MMGGRRGGDLKAMRDMDDVDLRVTYGEEFFLCIQKYSVAYLAFERAK